MSIGVRDQDRVIKRIRQACVSCRPRLKKIRCSGQRPACELCQRLSRECDYSTPLTTGLREQPIHPSGVPNHLQSRVTTLEAQLEVLTSRLQRRDGQTYLPPDFTTDIESRVQQASLRPNGIIPAKTSPVEALHQVSPSAVRTLIDEYFLYCHNKPYSLFHEDSFKQKWEAGLIPNYLWQVVLAAALSHSQAILPLDSKPKMETYYVENSWKEISIKWQHADEKMDLYMVQGMLLHSNLDLDRGKSNSASIKAGITVRLCQMLRLMREPDEQLTPMEQEERRRVFWSAYLLERFAMCGNPSILYAITDDDCRLHLPMDEISFHLGLQKKTQSLCELQGQGGSISTEQPCALAVLVLTTSLLGRCMKYACHCSPRQPSHILVSQLGSIESDLLVFGENRWPSGPLRSTSRLELAKGNAALDPDPPTYHFLAAAIYHLSYCILYHPLLLIDKFASKGQGLLTRILQRTWLLCCENTVALSATLRYGQEHDCFIAPSVCSYFAIMAASIHAVRIYSPHQSTREESTKLFDESLLLIQSLPLEQQRTTAIVSTLQKYKAGSEHLADIVYNQRLETSSELPPMDDFRVLMDHQRLKSQSSSLSPPGLSGTLAGDSRTAPPEVGRISSGWSGWNVPNDGTDTDSHASNRNSILTWGSLNLTPTILDNGQGQKVDIRPPIANQERPITPLSRFLLGQGAT